MIASRRGEAIVVLARDDQALAGDDDPTAVLLADGVDPAEAAPGLVARNGFRFASGGGRTFAAPPSIAATNVFVEGRDGISLEALSRS